MDETKVVDVNEKQTIINKFENDNPDSLEIGTPSKGGAIKVYGNFNSNEEFKQKIKKAFEVRDYANDKMNNINRDEVK